MAEPFTILFNGHDFKFLRLLISHFENDPRYKVLIDKHKGHVITDTGKSKKLLEQTNIIFCEWCLGNAEWYSNHKKENQILIIRLHHQEIGLHYLDKINWDNVDCIIFICQNNMRLFLERFSFMSDKAVFIYNPIDCNPCDIPKLYRAEFNLGFIGFSPKRKCPHLAFEILKCLKKIDSRYTLFLKGKQPWEYDWLWKRHEERRYYEKFYFKVNQSNYANSVVFDPYGDNMPEWFSKIGFLLSTSDHEGSHQAVAEGMASGAIPVIRNWAGADLLYPKRFIFTSIDEAAGLIRKWNTTEYYLNECKAVKEYAFENFDQLKILPRYDKLLENLLQLKVRPQLSITYRRENSFQYIATQGHNKSKKRCITAMHVCYINPGTQSGYATRVIEETGLLQKAGIHIIIACFIRKDIFLSKNQLSEYRQYLQSLTGTEVYLIPTDNYFDLSASSQGTKDIVSAIIDLAKLHNVDVIHGQALYSTMHALRANKQIKAKVVFDAHGASSEESELSGEHINTVKVLTDWEREALTTADLRIFVSNRMKEFFQKKYSLPYLPYTIIPCCVHSERFQITEENRLEKRQELGIEDKFVFLYLGTLSVWQWPEAMFSLFAQFYQKKSDSLFFLLLPHSDHEKALSFFERHNLPEGSYIIQEVSHSKIGSIIGVADVGLLLRKAHPVNSVSSPTKFGEYMAAGVPIIATENIGDTSNIILNENLGLELSLKEDIITSDELDKIICFIEDVQKNRKLWSNRCMDQAKAKLDWTSYGTIFQDSYRNLTHNYGG